jgi:Cd2+/Zn2+-exporting ATPase
MGQWWQVGSDRLTHDPTLAAMRELTGVAERWHRSGQTTVFAKTEGSYAVFGFRDVVRPTAAEVVGKLREVGVKRVVMLTGDRPEVAGIVAREAKVDEVAASLMPAEKAERIRALTQEGTVMMVGDGVNDAPSLTQATVGVAMGGLGSDIALEAADVVLVQDDLRRLPELIDLGRRTRRIIRANLFFAAGMILTLAVASFVTRLPLPIAVIGHEGSTVLVILNGLRLLK